MKKALLILVALISANLVAKAQLSIMPKFGVTLSSVSFSDELESALTPGLDKKSRIGITGGVALNVGVSDAFSIQPELLFVQKGVKFEGNGGEQNIIINYLEVPVLAKYSFGSESVKAYVNAGPSIGFGIGGKNKAEAGGIEAEEDVTFGTSGLNGGEDTFDNALDFGIQFGAGVGFGLGSGQVVLDVRYGLGLTNLFKAPDGVDNEQVKSQNGVLAVTVGYMIPLGGGGGK